jgi:hypothetical protein
MSGDSTAGMMTFDTSPSHFTACEPAAASIAPMTPPISACDELDGMPNSQVMRFQTMAPASPANTTVSVTSPVSTRPLAIVAATLSDKNAPMRFSAADRPTAILGLSALVAIDVAIALAVSWKPFVKSNASPVMMTRASTMSLPTSQASRRRSWRRGEQALPASAHGPPGTRAPHALILRNVFVGDSG